MKLFDLIREDQIVKDVLRQEHGIEDQRDPNPRLGQLAAGLPQEVGAGTVHRMREEREKLAVKARVGKRLRSEPSKRPKKPIRNGSEQGLNDSRGLETTSARVM